MNEREWGLRVWGERRSRRAMREAEKSRVFCKQIRESLPKPFKILCTENCDRPVTIGLRPVLFVTDCDRSVTISDLIIF